MTGLIINTEYFIYITLEKKKKKQLSIYCILKNLSKLCPLFLYDVTSFLEQKQQIMRQGIVVHQGQRCVH